MKKVTSKKKLNTVLMILIFQLKYLLNSLFDFSNFFVNYKKVKNTFKFWKNVNVNVMPKNANLAKIQFKFHQYKKINIAFSGPKFKKF